MAESSSPQEDSKSSSDDVSRPCKSYECVFCKRGFTTAQALGGHMNIHRKHRAPKINPRNDYSSDHHQDRQAHEGFSSFRPFFAIQTLPEAHRFARDLEVHVDSQTRDPIHDLLRENWRDKGLSLGISDDNNIEDNNDHDNNKLIGGDFYDDSMGLDLELRLGNKP